MKEEVKSVDGFWFGFPNSFFITHSLERRFGNRDVRRSRRRAGFWRGGDQQERK